MGGEAGWWADPEVPGRLRYWDGQGWTEQTRPMPAWPENPTRWDPRAFPPGTLASNPDVATINRQSVLLVLAGLVAIVLIVGVGVVFARRSGVDVTTAPPAVTTSQPSRGGRASTSVAVDEDLRSVAGRPCAEASSVPAAAGQPKVDLPVGPPPTKLVVTDLVVGTGPAVVPTDEVTVDYVGVACSTGEQFDTTWGKQPVVFPLSGVIPGWTEGLVGMQAGGRRQLVIPPHLGYGEEGNQLIAPGETLVFVIDLHAIGDRGAGTPRTTARPTATRPPATFPASSTTVCPAADGSAARQTSFKDAPPACIDVARHYTATIATDKGDIVIDLDPAAAPITVNNFVVLARYHYYDGVPFHRVIREFMAQSGDATGRPKGTGGPGYRFVDELPTTPYRPGDLAMANSGPDTNGSQFFIYVGPNPLGLQYTRFGHVSEGLDTTVAAIMAGGADTDGAPLTNPTTIRTVTIAEG